MKGQQTCLPARLETMRYPPDLNICDFSEIIWHPRTGIRQNFRFLENCVYQSTRSNRLSIFSTLRLRIWFVRLRIGLETIDVKMETLELRVATYTQYVYFVSKRCSWISRSYFAWRDAGVSNIYMNVNTSKRRSSDQQRCANFFAEFFGIQIDSLPISKTI